MSSEKNICFNRKFFFPVERKGYVRVNIGHALLMFLLLALIILSTIQTNVVLAGLLSNSFHFNTSST